MRQLRCLTSSSLCRLLLCLVPAHQVASVTIPVRGVKAREIFQSGLSFLNPPLSNFLDIHSSTSLLFTSDSIQDTLMATSLFDYWQEWSPGNIRFDFPDVECTPLDNNPFILQTCDNIPTIHPPRIDFHNSDGYLQYHSTSDPSDHAIDLYSDGSPSYKATFFHTQTDVHVQYHREDSISVQNLLPYKAISKNGQWYESIFPHSNYPSLTSDFQLLWNMLGLKVVSLERETTRIRVRGEYQYLWAKQE